MSTDIKRDIVAKRLERIAVEGYTFGHPVPAERQVPLVAFDRPPFVICEVKRRSPSKGDISKDLDAVAQAGNYVKAGVKTISVLTEEDYFGGSLADLMAVKTAYPDTAVLRKDFLVRKEDIEVSYRAGADAVLLIASLLTTEELRVLKDYAESLGLAVFLEVHSQDDVARARPLAPRFTGINSRDLTDFSIDRALPLKTRRWIDWPTRLVFESGIFRVPDARFAAACGFQGILVGEGVVKNPDLAKQLTARFQAVADLHPAPQTVFWARLFERLPEGRPFTKICGLTRTDDVKLADDLGADVLGFILAESKRRVTTDFVRSLPKTRALKVGVVVLGEGEDLPMDIEALLDEGFLDGVQFHGQESPALLDRWALDGYKALRLQSAEQLKPFEAALPPRILVDAFVEGEAGGTGVRIPEALVDSLKSSRLWLAGGLNPANIRQVIETWHPELVDASSGLESAPGIKDPEKLKTYFAEIKHARF